MHAKRTFASVMLLCAFLQASDVGTLEGSVTDPDGAVVSNVLVHFVRWGVGSKSNIDLTDQRDVRTDAHGQYVVELAPGLYDVLFSSPAFAPIAKKIEVKAGGRITLSPKMKYDRLTKTIE